MLFWIKETLIWFNLRRDGTGNGLSNIKDTLVENFELQMSVRHQSMCIFKAGLSSLSDGWANIKKKYLICQIPIKILKQHPIPNSILQNLRFIHQKGAARLVKHELC